MKHACAISSALLAALAAAPARALTPDDIVIIYNARSQGSMQVAEHYLRARNIKPSHLIPIECTPQESVSEKIYREALVPEIQRVLRQRGLDRTVKCLVTTYDVPLTIGAVAVSPANQRQADALHKRLDAVAQQLEQAQDQYDALGREGSPLPHVAATSPAKPALAEVLQHLNDALQAAVGRIELLPEPDRQQELQRLATVHQRVAGIAGLLGLFHVRSDVPDGGAGQRQLDQLKTELQDFQRQYDELKKSPAPGAPAAMVDIQSKAHGLIGEAQELETQMVALAPQESEACFDSELALVLTDQQYSRNRWIPNPNNLEVWPVVHTLPDTPRALMVTRIDGVTPAAAMDLVNTSLKIEKKGLDGNMYLDARGLTGGDAYAAFDQNLRDTYDFLKAHSTIDVTLDDHPELLEAINCPDAALYCGWYSLHNYQPSCQWIPGSIGYHVASLEMPTLHNPKDPGWANQMLQHGVVGTLGATAEPYLASFPKPSLFFPLLLSGQFTQGEVWEVTNPWLSWRIGYVGDPLYNPFKNKPRVTADTIRADPILAHAFEIVRAAPASAPAPGR
ncbi:MAG TPA: TIGR03790 family protein [Phycisphaerae bacterium]|nr:TIGR03790 family protein [Phycisphaerae bacterium]